jgi:hypothetical protein
MFKKQRILQISPNCLESNCGIAKYAFFLGKSLKKNYEIFYLTEKSKKKNKNLINIKNWKINQLINFIKIIKKYNPDIIHLHLADILINKGLLLTFIPIVSMFLKKKIVQTWHEPCGNRNSLKFFILTLNNFQIISPRPNLKELINRFIFFIFRFHFYFKKIKYIESSYTTNKVNISKLEKIKIKKKFLTKKKRLLVTFGHTYENKRFEKIFKLIDLKKDKLVIATKLNKNKIYDQKIIRLKEKFKNNCEIIEDLNDKKLFGLLLVADAIILPFFPYVGSWNTSFNLSKLSKSFIITSSNKQKGYNNNDNIFYFDKLNVSVLKKAIMNYSGKKNSHKLKINSWANIRREHAPIYSI